MQVPTILLISGLSCSGKSTLAQNLAVALNGEKIRIDDYYFETDPAEFEKTDFDDPNTIDVNLLASHLRALKSGTAIESPHYDFVECRYTEFRTIHPQPYLIVEGQYAAYYPALQKLSDMTIFLDVPIETCLNRRLERDQKILHRSLEDSMNRFEQRVAPTFVAHRKVIMENSSLCLSSASQFEWQTAVLAALQLKACQV